jgi:hypothetical protein
MCAMLGCASHNSSSSTPVAPATMPRIATVDERYQSYNVEMLEVTGGNFWKPYGQKANSMPATRCLSKLFRRERGGLDE